MFPQPAPGGVVEAAHHARHVLVGRPLQPPLADAPQRFALEVDDDEVLARVEHLAQVVVAVAADARRADWVAGQLAEAPQHVGLAPQPDPLPSRPRRRSACRCGTANTCERRLASCSASTAAAPAGTSGCRARARTSGLPSSESASAACISAVRRPSKPGQFQRLADQSRPWPPAACRSVAAPPVAGQAQRDRAVRRDCLPRPRRTAGRNPGTPPTRRPGSARTSAAPPASGAALTDRSPDGPPRLPPPQRPCS